MIFWVVTSFIVYGWLKSETIHRTEDDCREMISIAHAAEDYVSDTLAPKLLEDETKDGYIIEGMSGNYVSRKIVDKYLIEYPNYYFKYADLNPHNSENEADDVEKKILRYFKANPGKQEWKGIIDHNGIPYMSLAKPRSFQQVCLTNPRII